MLRYLALQMARRRPPLAEYVPVYIELRRLIDSGAGSLLEFINVDWSERYGFPDAASYVQQRL